MTKLFDLSIKALKEAPAEEKLSWNIIETHLNDSILKIIQMKFLVNLVVLYLAPRNPRARNAQILRRY